MRIHLAYHSLLDLAQESAIPVRVLDDPHGIRGYAEIELEALVGNAKVTFHSRGPVTVTRPPMVPQEEWDSQLKSPCAPIWCGICGKNDCTH